MPRRIRRSAVSEVNKSLDAQNVLDELMNMHAKTKMDLRETRALLFILLAINMAILGLIIGVVVKMLFL